MVPVVGGSQIEADQHKPWNDLQIAWGDQLQGMKPK